jgi:hypothetical protein
MINMREGLIKQVWYLIQLTVTDIMKILGKVPIILVSKYPYKRSSSSKKLLIPS